MPFNLDFQFINFNKSSANMLNTILLVQKLLSIEMPPSYSTKAFYFEETTSNIFKFNFKTKQLVV